MTVEPSRASSVAGVSPTLPRLSGNEASARSLIARHGADLLLQVASSAAGSGEGVSTVWRLRFSAGVTQPVLDVATIHVRIEWAGARMSLALPELACRAWLEAALPGLDLDPLPPALLATAVEAMLADIATALGTVSASGPARVLGIDPDGAGRLDGPHGWTLAVCSQSTGQTFFAALCTDALGLMVLAGVLSKLPAADNDLDVDSLPIRTSVTVGRAVLTAAELHSLQLYDVVMLDQYLVDSTGELWLTVPGSQSLRVRQEESSLIVTHGWTSIMTQTTDQPAEAEPQPVEGGFLDVDAIPVRLTFELGERQLTLGELRRLQPGETFDLHRPLADGPVMVRANGALIGTGELVEIDGRIGVSLSSLGKVGA